MPLARTRTSGTPQQLATTGQGDARTQARRPRPHLELVLRKHGQRLVARHLHALEALRLLDDAVDALLQPRTVRVTQRAAALVSELVRE